MVDHLYIFRLALEHFVRILLWSKQIRAGIHLRHLLCHLIRRWQEVSTSNT